MPIKRTQKILFQRNVAIAAADSILYQTPNTFTTTFIRAIWVCNTSGTDSTFSLYLNPNGVLGGDSYALYVQAPIKARATQVIQVHVDEGLLLPSIAAALIARAGAAGVITFTGFGEEVEET